MSAAKLVAGWDHTATLMAFIGNAFSGKDARPIKPTELNPYRKQTKSITNRLREIYNSGNGRSD